LIFRVFGPIFKSKKKKKKKKVEIIFFTFFQPYLLLDAPVDAHFALFPAGVSQAGNASSEVNEDIGYMATELVGQRGQPVGPIHKRVDFWVEHFCPDPYVRGILDHRFKVPVDWEKIPESYKEADNKSAREHYD
jgi:hypothetical protein